MYIYLSNNFTLPATTIASLYKTRWQIELFFKWIKQHLRIKAFWGHTMNTVKTQIWIAVSVYVLVAIISKRLDLRILRLNSILQVLSISTFNYDQLSQLFRDSNLRLADYNITNQLSLYDL